MAGPVQTEPDIHHWQKQLIWVLMLASNFASYINVAKVLIIAKNWLKSNKISRKKSSYLDEMKGCSEEHKARTTT